jgi:TRAP transporter TAXI family solute receptor
MKHLFAILVLFVGFSFASPSHAEEKIITIGTGSVTGVYYPAGGAVCRMVNRGRKEHLIRCFAESTVGSVANLQALREGELNMAIVQSDWQYRAYRGDGVFADGGPMRNLRSVFSLHSEAFTVAVSKESGIHDFSGLQGKHVNIGDAGSGLRDMMLALIEARGWSKTSFATASELKPADAAKELCAGKLDAMVFAAGHPNGLIQEITTNCGAKLIAIDGKAVEQMIEKSPYYSRTSIPGGMYQGNPDDVATFGVKATLVTTAELDEETVYQITKAVFDNFDSFQTLHFVFATLNKERMMNSGSIAPLHPGAIRYFRESGMMKDDAKPAPPPVVIKPSAEVSPVEAEIPVVSQTLRPLPGMADMEDADAEETAIP